MSDSEEDIPPPTTGLVDGLPEKPVRMNLRPTEIDYFRRVYGFHPIIQSSEHFHLHPRLAWERLSLEEKAFKTALRDREKGGFTGRIADVGSAARVVRRKFSGIQHICPNIQPGDATRMKGAAKMIEKDSSICQCLLQNCTHGPFTSLVFIHSAYYFNATELIHQISQTQSLTAYVVGHVFVEPQGVQGVDEANYSMDVVNSVPTITMSVKGNHHNYVHPVLPWNWKQDVGNEHVSLDIRIIAKTGDTYLWELTLVQIPVRPVQVIPWTDMIVDGDHVGPSTVPGHDKVTKQAMSANDYHMVPIDEVYSLGPIVMVRTVKVAVLLPKGLIKGAAQLVAFKERTPALFLDVVYFIRNGLKGVRLNDSQKLDALTIGAAMAFSMNVQNELNAMQTVTDRFSPLWKLHRTVVSLSPLRVNKLWHLYLLLFIIVFIGLFLWFLVPQEHHVVSFTVFSFAIALYLVCFIAFTCTKYWSRRTGDQWSRTLYHDRVASSIVGGATSDLTYTQFRAATEPLLPTQPVVGYVVKGEPKKKQEGDQDNKTPLHIQGVGAAEAVPTIPASNQDFEVSGLTNRVVLPPTEVDVASFRRFLDRDEQFEPLKQLFTIDMSDIPEPTLYQRWIGQTKFSISQRETFKKFRDTGVNVPPYPLEYTAFVKVEKMKPVIMTDATPIKPRIIQGPNDLAKVMCNPSISELYERVKKVWNGRDSKVLYASGMTPDAVGEVVDRFIESVDEVIAIWNDMGTYDATVENELLQTRCDYELMGMDPNALEWLKKSAPTKGVTHNAVKYDCGKKMVLHFFVKKVGLIPKSNWVDLKNSQELENTDRNPDLFEDLWGKPFSSYGIDIDDLQVQFQFDPVKGDWVRTYYAYREEPVERINSGTGDTNLIGTIVNARATVTSYPKDLNYLLCVCGDDMIMFMRKSDFSEDMYDCSIEYLKSLGLKPEGGYSEDRADWEFLSKLFWYGERDGKVQTVLGAKFGRTLHRVGWVIDTPNSFNLAGMLEGLIVDNPHVPYLKEFLKLCKKLNKGQKAKGKEHSELRHLSTHYNCVNENWAILERRYGFTKQHLDDLQKTMEKVQKLPAVISIPKIEEMLKRDQ